MNNSEELSDLTFLHLTALVACAGVGVAGVSVSNSDVKEWGSQVLKRGSHAKDVSPHSEPHHKELAVSAVSVVVLQGI